MSTVDTEFTAAHNLVQHSIHAATVDVLYNDCIGPQINCCYIELLLHRYNEHTEQNCCYKEEWLQLSQKWNKSVSDQFKMLPLGLCMSYTHTSPAKGPLQLTDLCSSRARKQNSELLPTVQTHCSLQMIIASAKSPCYWSM